MNRHFDLIRNTVLMKALSVPELTAAMQNGLRTMAYQKGKVLHIEGDPCHKLEIILKGSVTVERIAELGSLLTIAEFCQNDILGGNLLFSQKPSYPMTLTVRSTALILEVDRELLFSLLCHNPEFLRTFLEYVSDHASLLSSQIKHYANRSLREKLTTYLQIESMRQASREVRLEVPKRALAERLGVQRTSLSRELAKMRDDGLIRFDSKSITILGEHLT